jgi:hypothetical protein
VGNRLRDSVGSAKENKEDASNALTGGPARPRLKTYSGQSGYVYQYIYLGQQSTPDSMIFVFSVSKGRGTSVRVSCQLLSAVLDQWERFDGRSLSDTQRYAIAKMALFRRFDAEAPLDHHENLSPDLAEIMEHMQDLGLA